MLREFCNQNIAAAASKDGQIVIAQLGSNKELTGESAFWIA
jgi:hypothetical protein